MSEKEITPGGEDSLDNELESMMADLKMNKKKKKKIKEGDSNEATTTATAASSTSSSNAGGDSSSRVPSTTEGTAPSGSTPNGGATPTSTPPPTASSLKEDKNMYARLLKRVYDELRANNPDLVHKTKHRLHPPQVMRVGTSRILWVNFNEICTMMKRDPDHVFRFFLAELGTTGSIDGNQRFLMKGKFVPKYIESLLKRYINEYVTCSMCRGVDTSLVRDSMTRMYLLQCNSCGAKRSVAPITKGYHATAKGERRAARNTTG